MRGCIKEYTKGTERRLTERLKAFIRSYEQGRVVFVTLTTVETDPEIAKGLFQRWTKRISRQCDACGIYVMEFMENGQVHYHVLLALKGDVAYRPTEFVSGVFWNAWRDLGMHDRQAFELQPANLRDPAWILSYMPKADIEPGVPHPQRVQKRCPVAFKARGLRAAYWGVIGRPLPLETDLEAAA